ncbi:MAG: hypothetical protein IPP40_09995 [bacterium]|nr:hypothetical protein [bacterium]
MRGIGLLTGLLMITYCGYGFELKTFRIPTHTVNAWSVGTNGRLYNDGFTDRLSGSEYLTAEGSLFTSGYWLYDSEDLAVETWSAIRGDGSINSSEDRGPNENGFHEQHKSSSRATQQYYRSELYGIYFPMSLPIGVSLGGHLETDAQQHWGHGNWDETNILESVSTIRDAKDSRIYHRASGELALGWGRLRDASGAYQAYVLEQRLRELGKIDGELSAQTRQQLGELFYKRSEYYTRWERSEKRFWTAIEAVLKSDPAVRGPLDAFAQYRIAETIAPSYIERWSGWRFSFMVGGSHSNSIEKSTNDWRNHTVTDSGAVFDSSEVYNYNRTSHYERTAFGPRLEVNVPLSWTIQLTADSKLQHDIHPANDGFYWSTDLTAQYAMHDRWLAAYTFSHTRRINDPKERDQLNGQGWTIGHSARLSYYAEDKLRFNFSIYQDQDYAWDYRPNDPNQPRYSRQRTYFSLSFGVTYWLNGWQSGRQNSYLPRTHDSSGDWVDPYYW